MTFFQIIIILLILVSLILINRSKVHLVERTLFIIVTIGGIFLVIFPELASKVAHLVGIGRGSDLILYLFTVFSWFWFTAISAKMRRTNSILTIIVRANAIDNPLFGDNKGN